MGPTVFDTNPNSSFLTTGIWTKLQEIADNASLSVEETGSSATESDSIGSLRNSSPENVEKSLKIHSPNSLNLGSFPNSNRLSPMVTGNATAKLQKQILSYSA